MVFEFLSLLVSAAPWTDNDQKTIEANFVRVEGSTIIPQKGEKVFKISLTSTGTAGFNQS